MALTLSVDTARSSLSATSEQISVVSRNIAHVGDADATRKTAKVVSGPGGPASASQASTRSSDKLLLDTYLSANSSNQSQSCHHDRRSTSSRGTVDDTDLERSPAALISKLSSTLQSYSATPQNSAVAATVVSAAKGRGECAQFGIRDRHRVRQQARFRHRDVRLQHQQPALAVPGLEQAGHPGHGDRRDISDALDARDAVLKQLSRKSA